MPALKTYEPPLIVLFEDSGRFPVGVGFTCSSGPMAMSVTCSAGWTAASNCGSGCSAQTPGCVSGVTNKGCVTGYSANAGCPATGVSGIYTSFCSLTVCCTGSSGSKWGNCKNGGEHMGACVSGEYACGESCLTLDLCNPPS